MDKSPSPLLGFNNNVSYNGRVYHVQTEDSGVKHSRIVTHLFADGGRIVKTTRTEYHAHLEDQNVRTLVRDLMKHQHRAMYLALRGGEFDHLLSLPPPRTPSDALAAEALLHDSAAATRTRAKSTPPKNGRRSSVPPARLRSPSEPARALAVPLRTRSSAPPPGPATNPPAASGSDRPRRAPSDPKQRRHSVQSLSMPVPSRVSLFGDVAVDERPLDDAILTYLHAEADE